MEKLPNVYIVAKAAWVVADEVADKEAEEGESAGYVGAKALLQEGDTLFICVDNHSARKLLLEAARELDNITVINGGNEDDGFGCTYAYIRRNGVDITDYPGIHHDEFVNPPDKNPGELSCAERALLEGGTQVIATNLAVASTMIFDAHRVLFADAASGIEGNRANFAGVVLTNEKMFDLGYGTSNPYARCDSETFEEMARINPDVAEVSHGRVGKLEDTPVPAVV